MDSLLVMDGEGDGGVEHASYAMTSEPAFDWRSTTSQMAKPSHCLPAFKHFLHAGRVASHRILRILATYVGIGALARWLNVRKSSTYRHVRQGSEDGRCERTRLRLRSSSAITSPRAWPQWYSGSPVAVRKELQDGLS